MTSGYPVDRSTASVSVTTEGMLEKIKKDDSILFFDYSRRFDLLKYENKTEFMAAVNDYVTNELRDTDLERTIRFFEPFVCLVNKGLDSNEQCGLITDHDIDADMWTLGNLSQKNMSIFLDWYKIYGMSENSVEATLQKALLHKTYPARAL